jgi:hypothetical protein
MKIILLSLLFFSIISCSKKEEKFELFSAESFAYSIDDGWELNAAVRAKGFEQKENNNKFSAKLSYYLNLQAPEGKLINKISSGIIDKTEIEKISEIPIELQIELDSTYKTGNYKIIFYVKDELTGKEISIESMFELSK